MADHSESLVSQKSSDSGLHIQLHPLVLLTISDHITRHAARLQQGPIIGALLGQQNGRVITLEHAFECVVAEGPNGELQLPDEWFVERVKQFKDVHKSPALDLVGWWSTAPPSGPDPSYLSIHRQILQNYNESAVFLAFHPSQVQEASRNGVKLPLTIYESVYEGENAAETGKAMQVDGEEQSLTIRFRPLPYSVETGEAEMIGMDTVARTARTAAAIESPDSNSAGVSQKGGKAGKRSEAEPSPENVVLSQEEEELIASLNTRLNAVRTLESRIFLIKSYLSSISPASEDQSGETTKTYLSHPILRNINALLSHLSLLTPHEQNGFFAESLAQNNDVRLVSLLGELSECIKGMRELGRKTAIMNQVRQNNSSRKTQLALQSRLEEEFLSREALTHG
ncbi:COP9 signalosome complex subunit 6 [Aspergillus clavatus NRRL 1]|uniref:COP9 signalosome complex subunit 6 n=1 Tax=Aspergillus clavatus (strain ATCC 1007 / CBS 513.65 / DSM 816 / NCTC 3887 / NRRL 1 / QM 1276 / 107) TaxID=344612 RepID=A1CA57_ASPCL|nr:COP9 signalosome subunit 6 (CsnF), putative [Aspergillus clavatus NRRL 1]EAW12625.1 COP9 signalosome subunit 6 (CsnF), putative [Aspergillus clavatus NRRL 1]